MVKNKDEKCKLIHVKIINGTTADIYEIGKALKEFKKNLPYRLEAIITNDKIELQDVDHLLVELYGLKKSLDAEKLEDKKKK